MVDGSSREKYRGHLGRGAAHKGSNAKGGCVRRVCCAGLRGCRQPGHILYGAWFVVHASSMSPMFHLCSNSNSPTATCFSQRLPRLSHRALTVYRVAGVLVRGGYITTRLMRPDDQPEIRAHAWDAESEYQERWRVSGFVSRNKMHCGSMLSTPKLKH